MDTAPMAQLQRRRGARHPDATAIAVFRGIPYATAGAVRAAGARAAPAAELDATRLRSDRPAGARAPSSSAPTSSRTSSACRSTCGRPGPTTAAARSWCGSTAARSAPAPAPARSTRAPRWRRAATWSSITINYRLGLLGFLAHPDLAAGDGEPFAQLGPARLRRGAAVGAGATAAAFGGDPDDVTIFGESAGAAAVSLLCAMPAARGPVPQGGRAERRAAHVHDGRGRRRWPSGRPSWPASTPSAALRDLPVDRDPRRPAAGGGGGRRPHLRARRRRRHASRPGPAARIRDGLGRGHPDAHRHQRRRVEAVGAGRPAQPRPRRGPAAVAPRRGRSPPTRWTA